MKTILLTPNEYSKIMSYVLDSVGFIVRKRKGLLCGYIKSATYAKFEKCMYILLMDVANVKRYAETPKLWYEDFGCEENSQNKAGREDMIDHYFRRKTNDCFVGIFSLFEDALSRIFRAVGYNFEKDDFEEKVKKLKEEGIVSKDDRTFLRFCMHVRNTIHSNSFYRREDLSFEKIIDEGPFTFEKDKLINFLRPGRIIKWIKELVNIFEKISESYKEVATLKDNAMREDL